MKESAAGVREGPVAAQVRRAHRKRAWRRRLSPPAAAPARRVSCDLGPLPTALDLDLLLKARDFDIRPTARNRTLRPRTLPGGARACALCVRKRYAGSSQERTGAARIGPLTNASPARVRAAQHAEPWARRGKRTGSDRSTPIWPELPQRAEMRTQSRHESATGCRGSSPGRSRDPSRPMRVGVKRPVYGAVT